MDALNKLNPELKSETGWTALIDKHLERYPVMTVRDVYKLMYQGILGPEHIMPTTEIFTARLQEELDTLRPHPDESLFESIRPDSSLSRIYLRPWLALDQDISILVGACLETGKQPWGTLEELNQLWRNFLDDLEAGRYPALSIREARELDQLLKERSYPPVHHSDEYEILYQPAYRLVGRLWATGGSSSQP